MKTRKPAASHAWRAGFSTPKFTPLTNSQRKLFDRTAMWTTKKKGKQ